jgi:hypothetical protein
VRDVAQKESAAKVFNKITKAYEYLVNDITRIIYDEYGMDGLIVYDKKKDSFGKFKDNLSVLDHRIKELEKDLELSTNAVDDQVEIDKLEIEKTTLIEKVKRK